MANDEPPRLFPTGKCWCGCGTDTGTRSFFARGHDKVAEAALLAARYGSSVAQLIDAHGYGPEPERSVRDAALREGGWIECPEPGCDYVGAKQSIANHRNRYHRKEG